jgi:hypothetical protein
VITITIGSNSLRSSGLWSLVHDPDRGTRGASETIANHLYEVLPDRGLALIN